VTGAAGAASGRDWTIFWVTNGLLALLYGFVYAQRLPRALEVAAIGMLTGRNVVGAGACAG
jgi:hypothetical protein